MIKNCKHNNNLGNLINLIDPNLHNPHTGAEEQSFLEEQDKIYHLQDKNQPYKRAITQAIGMEFHKTIQFSSKAN